MDRTQVIKELKAIMDAFKEERGAYPVCIEEAIRLLEMSYDDDVISRQAAIDEIEERKSANGYRNVAVISELNRLEGYIMRLPSAQPERQKGEWIDYTEDGYVECPFCHSATNCDGNKDELHFCFSCGADMRGKQDG